jgi:hypothetical protein
MIALNGRPRGPRKVSERAERRCGQPPPDWPREDPTGAPLAATGGIVA